MAYGASLESWLGASPHGFESHILRKNKMTSFMGSFLFLRLWDSNCSLVPESRSDLGHILREHCRVSKTLECETAGFFCVSNNREAEGRRFLLV